MTTLTPADLSRRLRHDDGPFLARRRIMAGLSLAAMGSLGVVALYQVGIVDRLPDPPLPGFDADRVHGSAQAYAMLATPDAFLGLGSYAGTAALAVMGGPDRAGTRPWIPLALAAKVACDLGLVGLLTWNELTVQRALSLWSLLPAGASCATALLVIPEARAALQHVTSHQGGTAHEPS